MPEFSEENKKDLKILINSNKHRLKRNSSSITIKHKNYKLKITKVIISTDESVKDLTSVLKGMVNPGIINITTEITYHCVIDIEKSKYKHIFKEDDLILETERGINYDESDRSKLISK